jgi:hypothetical protein
MFHGALEGEGEAELTKWIKQNAALLGFAYNICFIRFVVKCLVYPAEV